jgi:hypothetical protein
VLGLLHNTRLEMLACDKHSRLFGPFERYRDKKLCEYDPLTTALKISLAIKVAPKSICY